jgi:hypothetical protein
MQLVKGVTGAILLGNKKSCVNYDIKYFIAYIKEKSFLLDSKGLLFL